MIKKFRLLHSGAGDWVGLYADENLIMEGHSFRESEMLKILSKYFLFEWDSIYDEKEDYLERYGNCCPKKWPNDL